MTQYAIMIFEKATPNGWADFPEEIMEAHGRFPGQIEELGGSLVNGFALDAKSTATKIAGDAVTDGTFIDSEEILGGFFVIEAKDLDHALAIAKLTPIVNGGVEVRPLLGA